MNGCCFDALATFNIIYYVVEVSQFVSLCIGKLTVKEEEKCKITSDTCLPLFTFSKCNFLRIVWWLWSIVIKHGRSVSR